MTDIHAIILTLNEEVHIGRCLGSVIDNCKTITVIDSGSSDRTAQICRDFGVEVLVRPWVNYSDQMNFGIRHLSGRGGWILRIDADEIVDPDSGISVGEAASNAPPGTNGILAQRRIYFFGKRIRHGMIEPSWQLRLWRNGCGVCEQRWMDEHIEVTGLVSKSEIVISDIGLKSLSWWVGKHNSYASREAIDILNSKFHFLPEVSRGDSVLSFQARAKRFLKIKVYLAIPSAIRPIVYFIVRYFVFLGFLDGKSGFYFHFFQALWYRTLVDAKIYEIVGVANHKKVSIVDAIIEATGIDPMLGQDNK